MGLNKDNGLHYPGRNFTNETTETVTKALMNNVTKALMNTVTKALMNESTPPTNDTMGGVGDSGLESWEVVIIVMSILVPVAIGLVVGGICIYRKREIFCRVSEVLKYL